MKAVIILPTYNEKKNIEFLIPRLENVFKKIKNHKMHIVIVDDNSPDKTADSVRKLQKKYKNIELLEGEKKGLGIAYMHGFKYVMNKYDIVFCMDADLQHPPEMIPKFLDEIDNGYDLVIGSRYIKRGDTPDWSFKRKFISKNGNLFARVVAGMWKVHDCTSGYRAIRTSLLKKVEFRHLATRGYAFLSTLLYELYTKGAKIKEIPLVFCDRKYGKTKLRTKDMIEFFFNSFRLRFKSSKRMIKFGIVGGSGIAVNLGIFTLAKSIIYTVFGVTNTTLLLSSLIGDEISIIYNFILNHYWTFKNSINKGHTLKKLFKFHIVAVTSVIINNLILFWLHNSLGIVDVLAKFIGILIAFLWNYFVNVKWTWREKIE